MFLRIVLFSLYILKISGEITHYDTYTGLPITDEEYEQRVNAGNDFWCVRDVKTCHPGEWRRVDGSCNNFNFPSRGAIHTPNFRILPAAYDDGYEPRKAKDGSPLPPPRVLRTNLLAEGKVPNLVFTQLATLFLTVLLTDVTNSHDSVNYIILRPYCCQEKGKTDPYCVPIVVPDDDPVHRFSDVRCLNLTRPESFQSIGCTSKDTAPDRIVTSTPLLDLSSVYGNTEEAVTRSARTFEGGLLKYFEVDGRIWPTPTDALRRLFDPTIKYTPDVGPFTGMNFLITWFWRHHNHVAKALSQINPHWDDDKLFYTARDINIAVYLQILYYESLPLFMGRENLIRDGVLSPFLGFRDIYDDQIIPQIAVEFPVAFRWFHTMQEGFINMYDQDGNYLRRYPVANLTMRTSFPAYEDTIDYVTQGIFRQASAKIDYVVDPEIAEFGLGPVQRALDVCTNDLAKNRYLGFPPYIKYKEYYFNKPYNKFEDLLDDMEYERVEILKERYKNVEDIDLLAGLWLEKPAGNGCYLPPTLYSVLRDQLLRSVKSDRHWYERPNRPHAFTFEQLQEIRKATISRLVCDVGDRVTRIQPHAFLKIGQGNEMCDCDELPKINYEAWRDLSCLFKQFI